ncbi:SusC/RagA family TonB-linked outer membrane protein [Mucilaginibacter pocheonensis]|uniref:TonB-linked SusC/RagA family outer membrane protein n=1 Tax=Mucilaginibacter pocheonensis TaxID=398050 RepID=A0ABU1T9V5_9SPHI|nr:TonB-dependent receptor [Mucilaginibacter pocheonensis]MDR6941656.1 TonB-linked SusC/RagA family outer membrane protein [Mucilaginibacter pocheonensis]
MKKILFNDGGCTRQNLNPHQKRLLKRIFFSFLYGFVCMLFAVQVRAQSTIVSGVVTNDKKETLPGVTVKVKGTTVAVATDLNGKYSINAPADGTLIFTFLGFAEQQVQIQNRTSINIQLADGSTALNEVVVVGYGVQQKKDLTGAVSVVKARDIQKRQATTVAEALQGQASGIKVRGGGQPGSEAQIQIRGLKNLSNTNPLYVIDGLITTANRDFNANDIESVQILKDASAAAIYGSRAANGVIIITTKKGKNGPMAVSFSGKTGVQTMPRYKLAQTDEFSRINFMAYDNANVPRQNLDLTTNTDWQKVAFRTGNIQDYNASFSGGSSNGNYFVSGGYFSNKGTVISTDFNRINFRVNTQGKKGIFTIGENLALSKAKANEISGNPIIDVIRMLPTIPVYNAANPGGYGYGDEAKARTFGTNPLAIANLEDRINENLRIRGNLFAELQFMPWLKYRLNLGIETSDDHYKYLRKEGNWTLNQSYDPAIASENRAESTSGLIEHTLSFNKTFGKHVINAVGGQSYQRTNYAQISGTKRNILVNNGSYYDVLDQGNEPQTGGYRNRTDLISYFGRVEYSFADKYLLNGVIRSDGSSKFGPAYKFGTFPSVSGAWRISKEDFFKVAWINDLKLRASYGTVGSNNIDPYEYNSLINTFSTAVFGADQTVLQGATQVRLANPDLRWEKLIQQNYGLDASFLDNKLTLSAEYFISKTKDVLIRYPVLLTTGNDGGDPRVNGITLGNRGFELSANYRQDVTPVKYGIGLNFTTLKNKVLDLGYSKNKTYVGNTVTEVGQPIGMWYVLETNGLFQNQAEIDNYKNSKGQTIQPGAKPGDIRFKDNNDDGQITNDDKKVVGSPWPKYELGLNFNVSYKGFEFSMDWFASVGAKVFNGPRSVTDRFDDNSNYRAGVQPWTPENPNTSTPRAYYASTLNSRGDSDRWLESGSFARMKYIGLSYRLPASLVKKIGFDNALVTLSAQNLLTITKYKGLDPEFSNGSIFEKGYDFGAFPNLKTVSLGLNFGF